MKTRILFLGTLLGLLINSGTIFAQSPEPRTFRYLNTEDGLSQSLVSIIYQDIDGYMWFGTNLGLNLYDGYEFTVIQNDPDDSTSISGNTISTIYEDKKNRLWIGTTGSGLNLFDRDSFGFKRYLADYFNPKGRLSENTVTSILETNSGNFWVGTYNGLNLFNEKTETFSQYFHDPNNSKSLSHNYINSMFQDSQGNFWIGTNRGLNLFNEENGEFDRYVNKPGDQTSLSDNLVNVIYEDKQGNLWIGTGNGLNKFDAKSGIFIRYTHKEGDEFSISGNSIFSIFEDSQGTLWIGTENNGLNIFDREQDRFYAFKQDLESKGGISNNAIYSIYESRDSQLWIGTYAGGLNILDNRKKKFEKYSYQSGKEFPLTNNSVTSFLKDSRGNVWVGTDGGGLNRFEVGSGNFYPLKHDPRNSNSLSSDVVLALLNGDNDDIWIGYYHGGLSNYNLETGIFTHYRFETDDPESICHEDVFALYKDSDGGIIVGTNGGGTCKLDLKTGLFTKFPMEEGVIRDILIDSRGQYWVSSYGGGLKLLNINEGTIWNFYDGDNGLNSNVVLTIYEDSKNRFWLGTKEGGLNLFDRDSLVFTNYTVNDGLPSNEIKGILEDDKGNLWLSTINGISVFNPDSVTFVNYSEADGLQSKEFNTLAYYKDDEGIMYFGGINGFNRFKPELVSSDVRTYPVVLTDFKLFNRSIGKGDGIHLFKHISRAESITLPHDATFFTVDYTALNFHENKDITYSYKLDGFDENWNNVGEQRSATYTNLDPGKYTFRVRVVNADAVLSPDEASIEIEITPPFWKTTWFYLLSTLTVLGMILGGYQWRVKAITIQNRKLEEQVKERTDQLRKKNEDLIQTMDDLRKTRTELVDNAHKAGMADIASGVLHNVGNLLNSVNTSSAMITDTMKNSRLRMLKEANDMLRENLDNLEEFITKNPRGKKLLEYYLKLEEPLRDEHLSVMEHSERLYEKIVLINDVISAQQSYASSGNSNSAVDLPQIINDTFTLYSSSIDKHGIELEKDFDDVPFISAQKTKLIHVLVNLIKNAKEAMLDKDISERKLRLKLKEENERVVLEFSDSGYGVSKENLGKLFNQGFSTKKKGHGFGLHSSANYMNEMGGTIKATSRGEGEGTTFILSFKKAEPSVS